VAWADQMTEDLSLRRVLIRPCLLLVLAEGPGHGYDIAERLKQLGFNWSGQGPIYRQLRSLERAELLRSNLETPGGPARRIYELTSKGDEALDELVQDLARLSTMLGELLLRHRLAVESRVSDDAVPPGVTPMGT
jgi:DNA-binding PadR family transcriptional regulator